MTRTQHSRTPLVQLEKACFCLGERTIIDRLDLAVRDGEVWQLHGPAGSGKSILLELLSGMHRLSSGTRSYPAFEEVSPDAALGLPPRFAVRLVSQHEQRRVAMMQSSFHQARWHSTWTEPLSVMNFLAPERVLGLHLYECLETLPIREDFDRERARCLVEMEFGNHAQQFVGQLSNGELKKILLIAAHLASPRLLLLDDPLSGLDPRARDLARAAIQRWCTEGQTLIYGSSEAAELAEITTHRVTLSSREPLLVRARETPPGNSLEADSSDGCSAQSSPDELIVSCRNLHVHAGGVPLLGGLDWDVHLGEHWMVTGHNGAGKSTLLALLVGDHPQAYSNDIRVLGTRLGETATLWERRRAVGFVAPELSWHYPLGWRLLDVALSGFDASIGVHRQYSQSEREFALSWLRRFGLATRSELPLSAVSEGEKRLALLARALVRAPRLLLLDEPTTQLTQPERLNLFGVLDELAESKATTLVLVTHHPEERPRCISHHLALADGRANYVGPIARAAS